MAGVKGQRSGGHNRKTAAQHKAEGTYKPSRHGNRVDLEVDTAAPVMPRGLEKAGKEMWKRICQTLPEKTVTKLDADSLRMYCETWQVYLKLYPIFRDDPLDSKARQSWQACVATLDKLGRQFGWTPQSRSALETPEPEQEDDPLKLYMERRKSS